MPPHPPDRAPHHHLPEEALLAYASGSASADEELIVACHLTFCPPCRAAVAHAEALAEPILARAAPVPLGADALTAVLMRIGEADPCDEVVGDCQVFPRPLTRRVGPFATLAWRNLGLGVKAATALSDEPSDVRCFLLDFPAGLALPVHGHVGVERTLVLRGGFSDERGTFERGDVSWHQESGHQVTIHEEGRCTALFVNDGPLDVGLLSKPLNWWVG